VHKSPVSLAGRRGSFFEWAWVAIAYSVSLSRSGPGAPQTITSTSAAVNYPIEQIDHLVGAKRFLEPLLDDRVVASSERICPARIFALQIRALSSLPLATIASSFFPQERVNANSPGRQQSGVRSSNGMGA
jgi:hypothetical protein